VRSRRSSIKFYDEIKEVGGWVHGKPALRVYMLCLSKDMPVKCNADRGEFNLPMPKQTGNHANTHWVTLGLS